MRSVRRHDLDSVTVITKVHRPGQSAIWVDGEIWRVFRRHHPLGLQDWSRKSELFGLARIPGIHPGTLRRTLCAEVLQLFDFAGKPLASAILQKSRSLIVRHLGKAVRFSSKIGIFRKNQIFATLPFQVSWSLRFVRRVIKQKRTRRRGTSL